MPRQPPLPKRLSRSRVQTHISGDLHERVDLYCARYGLKECQFFEAAAREKLEGTGDAKQLLQQLNLMSQQLELITEHSNLFVQLWMDHTPPLPPSERAALRRQTKAAYQDFVRQLATNLSGGKSFLRAYTKENLTPKLPRGAAQPADAVAPRASATAPVSSLSTSTDLS
jgi:hypothetical protein